MAPMQGNGTCMWTTSLDIPDAPICVIKLMGIGSKTVSNAELASKDWTLALNLG